MAKDKHITRRGVRAMMRPRPRRVTGRDPYKPPLVYDLNAVMRAMREELGDKAVDFAQVYGAGADELVRHIGAPIDGRPYDHATAASKARQLGGDYAAIEQRILVHMLRYRTTRDETADYLVQVSHYMRGL